MAIQNPLANTNVQERSYTNPYTNAAANAQGAAVQAGVNESNAEDEMKLKQLLGTLDQTRDKGLLDLLKKENPGAQTRVGDLNVGVDPSVALQRNAMKQTKAESDDLAKQFGGQAKDLEGALSQVESGLTGIKEGSVQGDKTAVAALTRLADGKGQRMTQAQLTAMTPASAQGSMEKMVNYWSGAAESGFTPEQRQAMSKLLMAHTDRLANEYSDGLNTFKEQAPHYAPTLAANGQLDPFIKTFGSRGQAMIDRIKGLNNDLGKSGASAPKVEPQGVGSAVAGVGSALKKLLFGDSNTAVAAPTASPAAVPSAPAEASQEPVDTGFDADTYLKGLGKRK